MLTQKLRQIFQNKKSRDFFIYGIGQAFNLLGPLIVAPYLVAVCKEQGFGKIGLGFALSLFLILIVDYAFDIKGTKKAAENRDNPVALEELLNTTIFTKIILFFIVLAIALLLVGLVPFFRHEAVLFLLSVMIVLAQVFNPVWFLQGIENFTLVTIVNIGSKVLYIMLVFGCIAFEKDYIYANLFLGASNLTFNLIGLWIIKNKYQYRIVIPQKAAVVHILRSDFSFCLSQLVLSVRQLSPLVLIGYFLGYFYAGQYKIIEQVMTLFRTFLLVFLKFFYPTLCYKILSGVRSGFAYWKKYTSLNFVLVLFGLSGIFAFAPEILGFFNAAPHSIASLTGIFRFSLLVPLLLAVNLPLEQLMLALGKNKIYIRIIFCVTGINLALILFLIQRYTLNGVIFSLVISESLFVALYFRNTFLLRHQH